MTTTPTPSYTIEIRVTKRIPPHVVNDSRGYNPKDVPGSTDMFIEISATDTNLDQLAERAVDALNYLLPSGSRVEKVVLKPLKES
jgi:hypothetical protein